MLADQRPFFSWWRATLAMMFGFWIARPDQATFSNTPAWDAFAGVAPEWFWGILLFVVGALQFLGLIYHWRRLRVTMAMAAGSLWGTFAFVFATHMPTGLSWIIYSWLAAASFHDYLLLSRLVPSWWPGAIRGES